MKLHFLIDTCVWLDIAKDYRQLPVLDALESMIDDGEACLILPQIIVDEFVRNKDRVVADSKRSLASHFRLVRDAMRRFGGDAEREQAIDHLNDIDHRIAADGDGINDAIGLIERIFAKSHLIATSETVKAKAADRAISKIAPFHRNRNGIDDAIIIETYIENLLAKASDEDVYVFVTHNIHDFSQKGGDTRLPHRDIEGLFNSSDSRYATILSDIVSEYAKDLIEEIRFEREYLNTPRTFTDLSDAEEKLLKQVWYNRHQNRRIAIAEGTIKVVARDEWEAAPRDVQRNMIIENIWKGAMDAACETELELGNENLGPWSDFEWGMVNGKLSAIRWALGDEWDMLDT